MTASHDEAARAEDRRRAEDGADVMRVGHLVENDEGPAVGGLRQILPVWLGEGLGFESGALMDSVGAEQLVEVAGADPLNGGGDITNGFLDAALSVFGQEQPMNAALRVPKGSFDRMKSEQPDRAIPILGVVAALEAPGFAVGPGICPLWASTARALLVAPRLVETRFLQGLPRLPGNSIRCPAEEQGPPATLPLFRLTGKALMKITHAKALPHLAGRFHFWAVLRSPGERCPSG
jgi:hypothetical protein